MTSIPIQGHYILATKNKLTTDVIRWDRRIETKIDRKGSESRAAKMCLLRTFVIVIPKDGLAGGASPILLFTLNSISKYTLYYLTSTQKK